MVSNSSSVIPNDVQNDRWVATSCIMLMIVCVAFSMDVKDEDLAANSLGLQNIQFKSVES
jgi:hypothetical protein